jgi:hypothetical protein
MYNSSTVSITLGGTLKSILLALAFAVTAVLDSRPCGAFEFDGLESFLSVPATQAEVPLPSVPLRASSSGLSGEALFNYLHETTRAVMPGTRTDYLKAKKYMFATADNAGCDGGPGVTDLYSQICVKGASGHGADYREQGDANGDGQIDSGGMNAEHSWPQGFFNKDAPMKADLHHIFPTFIAPNTARGCEPFAVVSSYVYSTNSGSKLGPEGFEPADAAKGDIARAMLYFVVRYYDRDIRDGMSYNNFWTSRVPMFLEWDKMDPPDAVELRRNDMIARFQGNRNPFVDDVTLAGRVGARVFQAH